MKFRHSALATIAGVLAALLVPPEPISPSAWAAKNLVVPDGEYAGEKISLRLTPYLAEPLDFFADDCADNKCVIKKSAQTGFTLLAIAAIGHAIDREPCRIMVVQPTADALSEFNREKLQPAIDATKALSGKVYEQTSRSAAGSTTKSKKFLGGSLTLAIATSTAGLRSKTIKKVIKDEASDYPIDLDGQGSPHDMIEARYESFRTSGSWKELSISTPVIKGACWIDSEFEGGDKRYWHVVCPGCAEKFSFDRTGLHFNKQRPFAAHYVAQCCGSVIAAGQKNALVQNAQVEGGGWIATAPGAPYRSYHFDALSSPFVPWDVVAERILRAEADPQRQKTLDNLVFGIAHEIKGDAPDYVQLMARREDLRLGHIPPGALLLTIACDVQMRGIYVEVLAHAPDQQTWPVYVDYFEGATTDVDAGAFLALSELFLREWPDAHGNRWRADEFAIDANYHTGAVYSWVRRHPGTKAVQGRDVWNHPALGVARDADIDYKGKRIRGGVQLRGVGTWPLKSKFYTYAAIEPIAQGSALIYRPGFCHFGRFLDEEYFKQITAEYLVDQIVRGRATKLWKQRGGNAPNHFLDCRIYNMAVADPYFQSFTADDWARRARERGIPEDLRRPDLFSPREFAFAPAAALKPVEGAAQAAAPFEHDPFAGLADLNKGL